MAIAKQPLQIEKRRIFAPIRVGRAMMSHARESSRDSSASGTTQRGACSRMLRIRGWSLRDDPRLISPTPFGVEKTTRFDRLQFPMAILQWPICNTKPAIPLDSGAARPEFQRIQLLDLPDSHRAVAAARGQACAVLIEGHGMDRHFVSEIRRQKFARLSVP